MDLDSICSQFSTNAQLLSYNYQIVENVWAALGHYGDWLTTVNRITIHNTLIWNFQEKKSHISLLLLGHERKYMQIC